MNPLLVRKFFIPDPEAHKMPDGRLYVYGSYDLPEQKDSFCSRQYRVFSCGDDKLEKWVDHGISFTNTIENSEIYWQKGAILCAPDAIYKDGKYYLFSCTGCDLAESSEAVSVSDNPWGPFSHTTPVKNADGDGIDPSVFVDDDGTAYLFWGQFHLRGGKLSDDMRSVEKETINTHILTDYEHGFHEGSSIRKRNGIYYLIYSDVSRGKATCLSYAMSKKPLGPYKKMGTIIDCINCDPQVWNNHGSIEEYKGQWYVFYHRSINNHLMPRRACCEKIFFNEDGTINEVEMTSQGASDPLNPYTEIDAAIACKVFGNCYIKIDEEGIDGEILANCGGGNWVDDYACYKYFNFDKLNSSFSITAKGTGTIRIFISNHEKIATVKIDTDEFKTYTVQTMKNVSGIQPIFLLFEGQGISVKSFKFHEDNSIKAIIEKREDLTIDFVGDSITWGENHCKPDETYTGVFAKRFADKFCGYNVCRYDGQGEKGEQPIEVFDGPIAVSVGDKGRVDFIRNGVCGNTVKRATERIDNFTNVLVNNKRPNITFFMFGINDSLYDDESKYVLPDTFKENYLRLLKEFIARNADSKVILVTPNWNDKPLEAHNSIIEEISREQGIPFIDLFSVWKAHYDSNMRNFGQGDWLNDVPSYDACHPTPIGAKVIGDFLFEEFLNIFDL